MNALRNILLLILVALSGHAQITSPEIRAKFGVDAELRANFFNNFTTTGNDDWFAQGIVTGPGVGNFVIDTTGAPFIRKRYVLDPNFRKIPFFRGMRFPQFSIVNGVMLIDGIFIRDHHGDDSTVFATGNKNAKNPGTWSTPIAQAIPNKDDILDIFMHVRRAGASLTDSLWMFGGVSIDGTTGNRYFDFEMYQTDIFYNRSTLGFGGYGPDAGHTTWQFDGAGNIIKAGDVIFTAEYSSSSLSMLEARIWVHKDALLTTPATFSWGGQFDGDGTGATYGYANILPKTPGDFYIGLQCANNTWAGPFGVVLSDNTVAADYRARQFMEFSVNLSKLGLDPLVNGNDPCILPFRRILIKSRASTSFNAELKDFVGPFSFFRAPMAQASADIPLYCGISGVSTITVNNPIYTSLYTWHTFDGNIVSDTVGPEITVNQAGSYIVRQELLDSCGTTYATDTVVVVLDPFCAPLKSDLVNFTCSQQGEICLLNWNTTHNGAIRYFDLERSTGNNLFEQVQRITASKEEGNSVYQFADNISNQQTASLLFYRIKITDNNGNIRYSKTIGVSVGNIIKPSMQLFSNPVRALPQLIVKNTKDEQGYISVVDQRGRLIKKYTASLKKGINVIGLDGIENNPTGIYIIQLGISNHVLTEKMILQK
jgi:hypothetical protein